MNDPENGLLEELENSTSFWDDDILDELGYEEVEDKYKYKPNPTTNYFPKKCTCGKDEHGFTSHLDFCPKYNEEVDGNGVI